MQRSGKHDPYPGGEIGNGEDPPAPPGAPPRLKRAALILHCGGRAVAGTRGGIVIFSDNIITALCDNENGKISSEHIYWDQAMV
ncbi:MAG: hypothetical protein WCH75_08905, partial [Candidatus Binatia bacterium]